MLILKDIAKTYDGKTVLKKIDLSFSTGDVVGLVGNNGEGKSTLFKIIAGEVAPDTGQVDKHNESIVYLPQHPAFGNLTVNKFLAAKLPDPDLSYKIDIALQTVGLAGIVVSQNCNDLSGGEKTKLYLASLLLSDITPTVLLLDEPTNSLDLDGLEWLERFIKTFKGIVLLTSHDRFFLDGTVSKTLELKDGCIKVYGGNYSFYKAQKLQEADILQRKYTVQQKKITRIEADIVDRKQKALRGELKFTSRDPYEKKKASKSARAAVVREKRLDKLLKSEKLIDRPKTRKKYGVDITGFVPSGKFILEVANCSKNFGTKNIFSDISFSLRGTERVWVVGKNGSGKSTLLKIVVGQLQPDSGEVKFGTHIKTGYFSQTTSLDLDSTGIIELQSTGVDQTLCYTTASYLHLTESDLRKKIGQLSTGQLAKLEFAKLLLSDNQLIVMDEPTNHLEIETREDIEEALQEYKGSVLVASHDRYFIERIGVDKIVEL